MTATSRLTVADLEQTALPDGRWELIAGELVAMSPTGIVHTRVVAGLLRRLSMHVGQGQGELGEVVLPDSGIVVAEEPAMVRSPDLGFIRAERCPPGQPWGFYRVVPDFVIEVRSPHDTGAGLMEKAVMWREAGAALVWNVDPMTRLVTVLGGAQALRVLAEGEVLDADHVVPGFRVGVSDVFAPLG